MQFMKLRPISAFLRQSGDVSFRAPRVTSRISPSANLKTPFLQSQLRSFATELPLKRPNLLEAIDSALVTIKPPKHASSFDELISLPKTVATNLASLGFTAPLDIQSRSIPIILAGDDTIIHSHTGTGKTLAFALPILANALSDILRDNKSKFINNSLILVPSRELGIQIESLLKSLTKDTHQKQTKEKISNTLIQTLYSGEESLVQQLKIYETNKPSILIATPKRFLEIIQLTKRPEETRPPSSAPSSSLEPLKPQERNLKLAQVRSKTSPKTSPAQDPFKPKYNPELGAKAFAMLKSIKTVVLDEADQLLKPMSKYATLNEKEARMRHPKPAALVLKGVLQHSKGAQLICSSATISRPLISELYALGFKQPTQIDLVRGYTIPESIKHYYVMAETPSHKFTKLCHVWQDKCKGKPALVVLDGHDSVDDFAENLRKYGKKIIGYKSSFFKGIEARALHREIGYQKDENLRNKAKEEFLSGKISLFVSTEDSIRGLDFLSLEYVFNLTVPRDANSYIHIAGRTGRMSRAGTVVNVVTEEELKKLDRLGMYLKLDINNISYE